MRALKLGQYHQVNPIGKDQVLVNLVILDRVISFPTKIKTPERFIRRVNKEVKNKTDKNGSNSISRYRLYYDEQNRIITFLMGVAYQKETAIALLESVFTLVDGETYSMMLSTMCMMYDSLPEDKDIKTIANFPTSVSVKITDKDKVVSNYVVYLGGVTDKIVIHMLLAAMSYVDKSQKTTLTEFEIDISHRDWLSKALLQHHGISLTVSNEIFNNNNVTFTNNFSFHQLKMDRFGHCAKAC